MTMEWLDANGHGRLAAGSVVVINGVSDKAASHGQQAAAVAKGACLAIVNVPWDSNAAWFGATGPAGPLGQAGLLAYTALAGVLVAGLSRQLELLRGVPT
jgi:hypothetical protein